MDNVSTVYAFLLCGIAYLLWSLARRASADSALKNIPGPPSASFWTGNIRQFYHRHAWDFHRTLTQEYGPVVRMNGFLNRPILYIFDPKALQKIVVKDQHSFEEEYSFYASNNMLFGPGLLSTFGDQHRRQKKLLSPSFSVSHLRHLLPMFSGVAEQLRTAIAAQAAQGPCEIDMLGWLGRVGLELVGQGVLGRSLDPLVHDTEDAFADAIKDLLPTMFPLSMARMFTPYMERLGPPALRRRLLELVPHQRVRRLMQIVDVMTERTTEAYREKKRRLEAGESDEAELGSGRDLLSVMLDANMAGSEEATLPEAELLAQLSTLIFAGMDTTSNALARMAHLLALHPAAQDALRRELRTAARDGALSYDALMQLPYLDAVCRETLRLHPSGPILVRQAGKDVVLPLSAPIRGRDGRLLPELFVPKDTLVMIGVQGSNTNKALWGADALEWRPERWLAPLPDALLEARLPGVYSHLMTFNGGGRSCIGFKFSELEMKTVLATLVPAFAFELPKGKIVWNVSNVVYPSMDDSPAAQMFLKVTPLSSSA